MKNFIYALVAIFIVGGVTGCSKKAPVYNVERHAMPIAAQSMTNEEIGQRISQVVLRRGWSCHQISTNKLSCSVKRRVHTANVEIDYSQTNFSIIHVSTANLGDQNGRIHRKYNKWIKLMEKDIINAMNAVGPKNTNMARG